MANKEAVHSVEMGLRYRKSADEGGAVVIVDTVGVTAPELKIRAEEMKLARPDSEATAVFRHVIYEDWAPIKTIKVVPHPTIPYASSYQVS